MRIHARHALVTVIAAMAIGGCQSVPSGIDPAYQVVDTTMLGDWKAANGTDVEIEEIGARGFEIEFDDGKSEAKYRGHLLEIGGKRFVEISLFQADDRSQVPVYHYALVEEIAADTLTHRPLRPEWLAEAGKNLQGAIYRSMAEEQPGSGGLVVRDRAAMVELLQKAAGDPNAFGPAETLKRSASPQRD